MKDKTSHCQLVSTSDQTIVSEGLQKSTGCLGSIQNQFDHPDLTDKRSGNNVTSKPGSECYDNYNHKQNETQNIDKSCMKWKNIPSNATRVSRNYSNNPEQISFEDNEAYPIVSEEDCNSRGDRRLEPTENSFYSQSTKSSPDFVAGHIETMTTFSESNQSHQPGGNCHDLVQHRPTESVGTLVYSNFTEEQPVSGYDLNETSLESPSMPLTYYHNGKYMYCAKVLPFKNLQSEHPTDDVGHIKTGVDNENTMVKVVVAAAESPVSELELENVRSSQQTCTDQVGCNETDDRHSQFEACSSQSEQVAVEPGGIRGFASFFFSSLVGDNERSSFTSGMNQSPI